MYAHFASLLILSDDPDLWNQTIELEDIMDNANRETENYQHPVKKAREPESVSTHSINPCL